MSDLQDRSSARLSGTGDGLPLAGVRVLDLTQVIAGPYATTMLADLGAEVVKVERPGHGDDLRTVGRYKGRAEHEDYFYANNRSKKSIALDLKDPAQRAVGQELVKRADVLVENFAPGVADRLGLGWETVRICNPRIIYCSLSGFGQTGPRRDHLALDPIIQAVSGIMSVTGEPDGEPLMVGAPLADVIAGMFAAYCIVAVLHSVRRDGAGRYIDISMQAALVAALGPRMGEALQAGSIPGRYGNQNPMRVPANTYRTADGRYLNVIVQNQRHWPPFCRALDRRDWIDDPRFATMSARLEHRDEIDALVAERFAEASADQWVKRLGAERVPVAFVNNYLEALADPQIEHRQIIQTIDHPRSGPIRVVGPPWIVSGVANTAEPPPLLDEHRKEVLMSWLGWPAERVERLAADGGS